MMDFKEFTAMAEQDIREALERSSPGVGIGTNQIEKIQGESYTALIVTPDGQNVGMNLNLNQLYDMLQRGECYDDVGQRAVDQAEHFISEMPCFNVAELISYETAKELLFVDVVGTKVNAEMFSRVPQRSEKRYRNVMEDECKDKKAHNPEAPLCSGGSSRNNIFEAWRIT